MGVVVVMVGGKRLKSIQIHFCCLHFTFYSFFSLFLVVCLCRSCRCVSIMLEQNISRHLNKNSESMTLLIQIQTNLDEILCSRPGPHRGGLREPKSMTHLDVSAFVDSISLCFPGGGRRFKSL